MIVHLFHMPPAIAWWQQAIIVKKNTTSPHIWTIQQAISRLAHLCILFMLRVVECNIMVAEPMDMLNLIQCMHLQTRVECMLETHIIDWMILKVVQVTTAKKTSMHIHKWYQILLIMTPTKISCTTCTYRMNMLQIKRCSQVEYYLHLQVQMLTEWGLGIVMDIWEVL